MRGVILGHVKSVCRLAAAKSRRESSAMLCRLSQAESDAHCSPLKAVEQAQAQTLTRSWSVVECAEVGVIIRASAVISPMPHYTLESARHSVCLFDRLS
jgi:hypothetical protein